MNEENKQKAQVCQDDFRRMLEDACFQAGGGNPDAFLKMSLYEVMKVVAQNGIRMVYLKDRSITSLKSAWTFPRKSDWKISSDDLPKKKQLLCDIRDADLNASNDMNFSGGKWEHDAQGG